MEKTLKDGATLQLAKDKLLAMDEAFIRDFAECVGTVFAATVKKAGGLGQFALLTLLLSCHCHSLCQGFALYLPPAWLMVERIMGPDCWVGFKVGVPCVTLRQRQDLQLASWAPQAASHKGPRLKALPHHQALTRLQRSLKPQCRLRRFQKVACVIQLRMPLLRPQPQLPRAKLQPRRRLRMPRLNVSSQLPRLLLKPQPSCYAACFVFPQFKFRAGFKLCSRHAGNLLMLRRKTANWR